MNQFVKFLFVGVLNTAVGYGIIFACMYVAKLSPEMSNLVGYGIGVFFSFYSHRLYTFESKNKYQYEIAKFVFVFLVAYALNFVTLVALVRYFKVNPLYAQIISGALYVGTSFLLNKYFVFRSHGDRPPKSSPG